MKTISKELIECFLGLLHREVLQIDIVPALNISLRTVQRLYARYLNGEFFDISRFKSSGDKKKETKKDHLFEKNFIAIEIAVNPCVCLKNLSEKLNIYNAPKTYYPSTVSRIIKDMNYTRKTLTAVPINRNSNANKEVRFQYGTSLNNIEDNKLIFLDESGFNLHLFQKLEYSPKNTKCYITVPNSKGTNISLFCAINLQGICAFKIKVGSFKSSNLSRFITKQLPPLAPHERKYVVMDNASIHKTSEVGDAFARKNYI
ncbi:hypothetical protein DMUE_3351 [Dictyocoela muelleri]|nr:hypothetical protein DMUE_3351 [Dictyocoela muelleri]